MTTCKYNIIPSEIDYTSETDSTPKIDSTSENNVITAPNNNESASSKNLMITSVQDSTASEEHKSVSSDVAPSENVITITSEEIETASRVASMTISENVNEEASADNAASSENDDTSK